RPAPGRERVEKVRQARREGLELTLAAEEHDRQAIERGRAIVAPDRDLSTGAVHSEREQLVVARGIARPVRRFVLLVERLVHLEVDAVRSEERRVGKEGRCRLATE